MTQPAQPAQSHADRRKSQRLPVRGRLVGCLLEIDRPVRIRDIGFGGFATETIEPLPVRATHAVQFTTQDDSTAVIPAVSLYSCPSCSSDGTPCFVTGFGFRPDEAPETTQAVQMLIEKVTAVGLYRDH